MNPNSPIAVYIADVAQIRVGEPLFAWPRTRNAAELIKTSLITQVVRTDAGLLVRTEEGGQYLATSKK